MKRKYFILVIFIIAAILIGIGIISIPSLIEVKSRYEYSLFVENVNKAFEENQKENMGKHCVKVKKSIFVILIFLIICMLGFGANVLFDMQKDTVKVTYQAEGYLMKAEQVGTYCIIDMEKWLGSLGYEMMD